jgi:hypothetical protein
MTIAGVAGRFVQGIGRHLRLEAENLRLVAGYASTADGLRETSRVEGHARVIGDTLARAGFEGTGGEMALVLRPFPAGKETRILLTLSYREDENDYHAELWAPSLLFDALKRDILAGAAERLTLGATTSLWVREEEREANPALPVGWHLGVEPDGQRSASARGLVETIDWSNAAGSFAQPQPLFADAAEEPPEDPVSEELSRINGSLRLLLLMMAFLLIIVAMK